MVDSAGAAAVAASTTRSRFDRTDARRLATRERLHVPVEYQDDPAPHTPGAVGAG